MAAQAYKNFLDNLKLSESLLQMESVYNDPPPITDQKNVEALRGGANVLMVAAFESYLKELVEEHLSIMASSPIIFNINLIPDKMRRHNVESLLDRIKHMDASVRVVEYERAAQVIADQVIIPDSFTLITRSNPNADNVKQLFKSLGIEDVYQRIKLRFEQAWGVRTPSKFIELKLEYIVDNRHNVAHAASALNISRTDLQEWLKFLKILGEVLDEDLATYISAMI